MPSKVKNYLIILLAVATACASGIAWSQARRLTALQDELLKTAAAATAVKHRPAPVAAEFTRPAPAATPAATAEVEPAAAEEPAAQRPRGNNNNRPNFAALMNNPEFARAMTLQQRAALDSRYAALFKQLKLPPEQLEKLKSLLVERQNARMDVMLAARENGMNPRESRDELRKLTDEAQAEVDANIKASLGESVYNQYQNYENTQSQRSLVSQLDQRLAYSSTPLSEHQSAFLVKALAETGTTESAGPGGWGGGNRATITDTVIAQAQSVLTSDQVAALKQLQIEQQAQQQVRDMMRPEGAGRPSRN